MLAVQNYQTPRVAFKANEENQEKPVSGNNTHAGLKTGAVYAGLGSLGVVTGSKMANAGVEFLKQNKEVAEEVGKETIEEMAKGAKALNKSKYLYLPIFILTALGCGALVDNSINKKRANLQQRLATEDKKAILESDDNVDTTAKGNLYYKSSVGKKLGTVLGAVALPALGIIQAVLAKSKVNALGAVTNIITGAIGGLALGAITDACANKKAKAAADKQ